MATAGKYTLSVDEGSPPRPLRVENMPLADDSWSDVSDSEDFFGADEVEGREATSSLPDRLVRSVDLGRQSLNHRGTPAAAAAGYNGGERLPNFGIWDNPFQQTLRMEMGNHLEPLPQDSREIDTGEKLKTKFLSAWNNMRYGFTVKLKTNFRYDSPIWILGKCFHRTREEQDHIQNGGKFVITSMEKFKQDFSSRLWFTYRREFAPLPGTSSLTTDVGWGCMLRTGQMMLAQALVLHFLGRDWRWYCKQTPQEMMRHKQIIKLFGDFLSDQCPFSIHHLVKCGINAGKKPGDWYGPASVAHILKEALNRSPQTSPVLWQLRIYVAQDSTVYKQDVIDLCLSRRRSSVVSNDSQDLNGSTTLEETWQPVIILIPARLGGEALNPIYVPCVQGLLTLDQCVGIMGGRPKHSVFFIGWQEDKAIYLDPHFCQDVVDVKHMDYPIQSYHCMSPRKMPFTKMDPSCTIAFYCHTHADFIKLISQATERVSPPMQKGLYPIFIFADGRSSDILKSKDTVPSASTSRRHNKDLSRQKRISSRGSEDFVFLE